MGLSINEFRFLYFYMFMAMSILIYFVEICFSFVFNEQVNNIFNFFYKLKIIIY